MDMDRDRQDDSHIERHMGIQINKWTDRRADGCIEKQTDRGEGVRYEQMVL
jgi:hypothetical protein